MKNTQWKEFKELKANWGLDQTSRPPFGDGPVLNDISCSQFAPKRKNSAIIMYEGCSKEISPDPLLVIVGSTICTCIMMHASMGIIKICSTSLLIVSFGQVID